FCESLVRALERQHVRRGRIGRGHGKHLPADFEDEVVAPLNLFGGARKAHAARTEPLEVHGERVSDGHLSRALVTGQAIHLSFPMAHVPWPMSHLSSGPSRIT